MKSKKLLCIACLFLLVLGVAGTLWAQGADYNRPNPLMDYAPQELGIYDTGYAHWDETGCRSCHGNSTADRHHGTYQVVHDHVCSSCHPVCTAGTPDCENGIMIHRDCLTSGCHSSNDVQFGNEKWHHNTDLASAENCTACHNPNLLEEITPFRDFSTYPPSVVTPTPFSCENCHWEQGIVAGSLPPDGNAPGHPSTYEHRDAWGQPPAGAFYEYNKPILNNIDTHHMGFVGEVASECYKCHAVDEGVPSWDPTDPEIIRACEICHSVASLHNAYGGILPHVSDTNGWVAIGFHAGGGGTVPTTYQKDGPTPYTPQVNPSFTIDQMCYGCHGDAVPAYVPPPEGCSPTISLPPVGLAPVAGSCGVIGQLRGECFGEEHVPGSNVMIAPKTVTGCDWASAQPLPINAWNDNYIEWSLPCWAYAPGNYCIRVKNEVGNSNRVVFSVKEHPTLLSVSPASGACTATLTLSGDGFDTARNKMYDTYFGVSHVVVFDASAGEYTVTKYVAPWTDAAIQVKVQDFFRDQVDTCSIDPLTQQPRMEGNFVRDLGAEGGNCSITTATACLGDTDCPLGETCIPNATLSCDNNAPVNDECAAEPILKACNELALGTYSVYVKAIYFGDDDASGGLSCGDTIFQVETSGFQPFELTNDPYIYKLNPKQVVDNVPGVTLPPLLRVYGGNYGVTQEAGDCVRIGSKVQGSDPTLGLGTEMTKIKAWSNTLIKLRVVPCPDTWRGKTKYVWVEKDGVKSNAKPLAILAP